MRKPTLQLDRPRLPECVEACGACDHARDTRVTPGGGDGPTLTAGLRADCRNHTPHSAPPGDEGDAVVASEVTCGTLGCDLRARSIDSSDDVESRL